jgi:hypothetical protein
MFRPRPRAGLRARGYPLEKSSPVLSIASRVPFTSGWLNVPRTLPAPLRTALDGIALLRAALAWVSWPRALVAVWR